MAINDDQLLSQFEEIKSDSIFALAKLINLYGLTFSESRLFSYMYLENTPMTLDEMSLSLGMSKTSMSTGVRSLLDAQMVERTWKKGIRKDLYIAEDDLYKSFSNSFIEQFKIVINSNVKEFKDLSKKLESLALDNDNSEIQPPISEYLIRINEIIMFHIGLTELFNEFQNKIDNL